MVHSDAMFCFVQAFTTSKKKEKNDSTATITDSNNSEESSSKSAKKNFTRKLSFRLKKKSPSSCASSLHDDRNESSPDNSPESYQEKMNHQDVIQQHAAAAAAADEILTNTPGSSKARQKKFHRNFKDVPPEERVINYYSCALVGDVLLHGNLYITKNFFAFYSNIFGNENKILLPTSNILSINKEKTALIKPNAIAITSLKEKYIFGLFISRDSTYKLLIQVWNAAMNPLPSQYLMLPSMEGGKELPGSSTTENFQNIIEDDSSLSGSDVNISPDLLQSTSNKYKILETTDFSTLSTSKISRVDECCQTIRTPWTQYIISSSKVNIVLVISTVLLTLLFLSAGILLYRISYLQQSYDQDNYYSTPTRSVRELQDFFSSNLQHISKIRRSLEALSLLIEKEDLLNEVKNDHDF